MMTTTPSALACRCLNFNIHPQKLSFHKCDPSHLGLSAQEESDAFFGASVAEIKLGLGGITTKHQFLVRKRTAGEWQVYSCLGCRMDVYAEADGKLLVSSMLEHEPNKIESLQGSQGYSPCYRIVLPSDKCDLGANTEDADLQVTDPKVDTTVRLINEQLAKFLQQEQDSMEQRIRMYQEQQNKKFDDLRTSATKDREAMVALISSIARQEIPETLSEALVEETSDRPLTVPQFTNSALRKHREANIIQDSQEKQTEHYCNMKNMGVKSRSVMSARRARAGSYQSYLLSESVDTSQIFQLDGFEDEDGPFPPASSEDEADTDDSSFNDEPCPGMKRSPSDAQYASSLPVNVPTWQPSLSSHHIDDDEDEEERRALHAANPERIGQDIQALARSVHDGTEMFGDLPRPRLNTNDFKSRPI